MKSIFKGLIVFLFVGTVSVPTLKTVVDISTEATKTEYTYLLAGLDDAASNTDVLIAFTYSSKSNASSIIQIPRDTYCQFGENQGKLNHLYASLRNQGLSKENAMKQTTDFIGESFGISFDGYIAITTGVFREAVDSIGGVVIILPEEFVYNDPQGKRSFVLPKGENIIDGRTAEIFVRHRKGYALGDLGRLDAQKIFINGLYNTVVKRIGLFDFLKCIKSVSDGVITDFSLTDFLIMVLKHSSKFKDVELSYLTMPGESVRDDDGIWYYILNSKACEKVLLSHFKGFNGTFDIKMKFTDIDNPRFNEIYNRTDIEYKEYSVDELGDIHIVKSKALVRRKDS